MTRQLTFVPLDLDAHLALVHRWMGEPHVAPWWDLDGPIDAVARYLADQLAAPHLDAWIVTDEDDGDFAYVETYRAAQDPLADQLRAAGSCVALDDGDRGFHLLVGPPEALGTGLAAALGRSLLARLFDDPACDRVVCEPDVRNERMRRWCASLGLHELDQVDLPDKRAAIAAISRKDLPWTT